MLLHSSDFHCEVSPEICDKVDIDWDTRKNKDLSNAAAVRHCHVHIEQGQCHQGFAGLWNLAFVSRSSRRI